MRTTVTILILLALTSCACVSKPRNPEDPSPRNTTYVTVSPYQSIASEYPRYDILLKFTNHTGYTHLIQEIELEGGWWLVECFRVPKGHYVFDHHSGGGWRRCRVYPANVVGALEPWGFAHLMQNQDGTVRTNIPAGFNTAYREACGDGPWPGVIVKQAPEMCSTWRLTPDSALRQVEVWTGDGIVFLRG